MGRKLLAIATIQTPHCVDLTVYGPPFLSPTTTTLVSPLTWHDIAPCWGRGSSWCGRAFHHLPLGFQQAKACRFQCRKFRLSWSVQTFQQLPSALSWGAVSSLGLFLMRASPDLTARNTGGSKDQWTGYSHASPGLPKQFLQMSHLSFWTWESGNIFFSLKTVYVIFACFEFRISSTQSMYLIGCYKL